MTSEHDNPSSEDDESIRDIEQPSDSAGQENGDAIETDLTNESSAGEDVVLAQVVSPDVVPAAVAPIFSPKVSAPGAGNFSMFRPPSLAQSGLDNMAAKGGAYGSLVLGIWASLGSLLTPWSAINGVLGLLLGVWGLTSHHQKISWIGIILSLLGIVLSFIEFSDMVRAFLPVNEGMEDL